MQKKQKIADHSYTETEAAEQLGISLQRLYELLDDHIFIDSSSRPAHLIFDDTELLILAFWDRLDASENVIGSHAPARPSNCRLELRNACGR